MSTDKMVYICGDFSSEKSSDEHLKALVLSSVGTLFYVRSHPMAQSLDARFDTSELYQTVTRCHTFVFIFSKETIDDTFYLNQYGIAKAYGIPIIGVREPSYFMPNPLPEQFYFTEIVDYTGENRDGNSNRTIHGHKKHPTLAEVLIQDFKTAMVYAAEFHRSCAARLLHKVTQACNRSENEKKFYADIKSLQLHHCLFNNTPNENSTANNKIVNAVTKCPKCGFSFNKMHPKPSPLVRASSTGSLLRKSDAFELENHKLQKKTALHPTTIHIPSPQYKRIHTAERKINRSPIGSWAHNNSSQKSPKPIEPFKGRLQSRHSQLQSDNVVINAEQKKPQQENITEKIMMGKENIVEGETIDQTRLLRKQSRVLNATWSEKLRMKLRRQSSLPVIPTTYLVTSPTGLEKQLSFVRYPPELSSARNSLLPVFSEDEEQETIHISRAPSPDTSSWVPDKETDQGLQPDKRKASTTST